MLWSLYHHTMYTILNSMRKISTQVFLGVQKILGGKTISALEVFQCENCVPEMKVKLVQMYIQLTQSVRLYL